MMRPIEIEMIRAEVRGEKKPTKLQQFKHAWQTGPEARLLQCKKANDWMKQEHGKPAARSLFGGFWFEHELCILFADTNLGKSILAVQIADSLTKNYSIGPFTNQAEAGTTVLYLDCEQSAKQFEARYTDSQYGSYLFADMFYRGEFHPHDV
jgi:predicted ATP-dependent serine protease